MKTLGELVAKGKKEPLTFSSAGNGSPGHFAAEVFSEATGAKITHIPYKGNSPAVLAILSGEVQAGILATPGMVPHVQAGKITPLAVTSRKRSVVAPELPTVAEAGVKDLEFEVLQLAMVPAATPAPVVEALRKRDGRCARCARRPHPPDAARPGAREAVGRRCAEAAGRRAHALRSHRQGHRNENRMTNLVFILADDLGFADLGCYGGRTDGISPALDRMAAQGVRFTRAYSNSPVCSPTRFGLITGRYQYRLRGAAEEPMTGKFHGSTTVGLPPEHPTLPSLLKAAGHRTALVGKWHLGYPPHFGPRQERLRAPHRSAVGWRQLLQPPGSRRQGRPVRERRAGRTTRAPTSPTC